MELVKSVAQCWEYKILHLETWKGTAQDELDAEGQRGWELVAAQFEGDGTSLSCVFKKPAQKQ